MHTSSLELLSYTLNPQSKILKMNNRVSLIVSEKTPVSTKENYKDIDAELPQKKYGARPELTTKQKLELSKAFGIFDPRGSGLIEQRGFMLAMRALGFEPKFSQVDELIAKVTGRAVNETLDFKDFYNLLNLVMTGDDTKDDVKKAFKMFSSPETGVISLENLEAVSNELGEDISTEKLQEMISFADKNGDGVIDLQEFIAMMERPMLE